MAIEGPTKKHIVIESSFSFGSLMFYGRVFKITSHVFPGNVASYASFFGAVTAEG